MSARSFCRCKPSRGEHARIVIEPGFVYLEDLKSLNGTLVNGRRIEGRVPLNHGDRIEIHDLVLGYRDASSAVPANQLVDPASGAADECEDIRATTVVSAIDVSQNNDARLQVDSEIKLRAIVEMIRNSGTSLDIDVVLPKILESLFRIFPQATQGHVLLAEGDGRLVPRATRNRDGDAMCALTLGPLDVQFARRVMSENKALLGSTAADDTGSQAAQTVFDVQVRSVMCAPAGCNRPSLGRDPGRFRRRPGAASVNRISTCWPALLPWPANSSLTRTGTKAAGSRRLASANTPPPSANAGGCGRCSISCRSEC